MLTLEDKNVIIFEDACKIIYCNHEHICDYMLIYLDTLRNTYIGRHEVYMPTTNIIINLISITKIDEVIWLICFNITQVSEKPTTQFAKISWKFIMLFFFENLTSF